MGRYLIFTEEQKDFIHNSAAIEPYRSILESRSVAVDCIPINGNKYILQHEIMQSKEFEELRNYILTNGPFNPETQEIRELTEADIIIYEP